MENPEQQFSDAELTALLRSIDHRPPRVEADALMHRVRRRRTMRSALLAACALASVATIATAASPGSALNRIVRDLMGLTSPSVTRSARPSAKFPPGSRAEAPRGIAFVPGERANIVFRGGQASGELHVDVDDVTSVQLTQTSEGGETRLELTPDGVVVGNEGTTASYSLVLPRTLARATVRVGGRAVVTLSPVGLSCGGRHEAALACTVSMRP